MGEGFLSWEAVFTLAGAASIVYLWVSYTKAKVPISTDLYAWLVAAVVLNAALWALGQWTVQAAVLAMFNALLVAAATGKMNDSAVREASKKQGTDAGV